MDTAYWSEYRHQEMTFGLISTDRGLSEVLLPHQNQRESMPEVYLRGHPYAVMIYSETALSSLLRELDRYFHGAVPEWPGSLDLTGTAFQLAVWNRVKEIPYGKTVTYGEIAEDIGHPRAARAVGKAVGDNPIPLVIPCHRVVGSNGTLTGFAGGLHLKEYLLRLEGVETIKPLGHARFAF